MEISFLKLKYTEQMGKNKPVLHINIQQARKFLLNYHFLQYSEPLKGKSEILDYIRKVGCIQFDPVDVVGRNPDLVLNARARNYQTGLMDRMLYKDRSLLDGWDKVQSIYPVEDFPIFSRRKGHYVEEFKDANPGL